MVARPTLALVLLSSAAPAQVVELWSATYDAPTMQADWGYKAAADAAGNVYVTGRSLNPSVGIPPAPPTEDTITLKYDAGGALLWERRYDGYGGNDNGRAVAVDPADGSVYSLGHSQGQVGATFVTDIRLLKYDANGTLLWSRAYDGPGASADFGRALAIDPGGDVYAGGYAYNAAGDADGVVVRYDPAGNLVWAELVGGSGGGNDFFATIALGPTGDVHAVGQASPSGGGTALFVARISASGTTAWAREHDGGGTGVEYALGLAVDASGATYASGYSSSLAGGQDAALLKYDGAGTLQWARAIDGSAHGADQGVEVGLDAQGGVYLSGYVTETGTGIDYLLAKHDAAGNLLWRRTWDGSGGLEDRGQWLEVDALGRAAVVGHTTGASGGSSDKDVAVVRWDAGGDLLWAHVASSPGIDDDRPYDLAPGAAGALVVTGSRTGASQPAQDAWTFVLKEQSTPFCFGDGSLASCPCGNDSPAGEGRGCLNSTGASAQLTDAGAASLANDTLVLTSAGELATALSIFLQGDLALGVPALFGDGLRCVGGGLKRLYAKNAVGGVVSAPGAGEPSVSARSAELGDPLAPGDVRHYQVYYRDPALAFCAGGGAFNVGNALRVTW